MLGLRTADLARVTSLIIKPDSRLVRSILATATGYCAQKMTLPRDEVVAKLREGCTIAHGFFRSSLVRQLAGYLGKVDHRLKAVYYGAIPDEDLRPTSAVNLLLWVEQDSPALVSLTSWFDSQLVDAYKGLLGPCASGLNSLLNIKIVEDEEVSQGQGYGAYLHATPALPFCVWKQKVVP